MTRRRQARSSRQRSVTDRGSGPAAPVAALCVLLAAAAAAVYVLDAGHLHEAPEPHHVVWPVLALLFAAAEALPVRIELRESSHALSLSEIPLVLGLVFASPGELLSAGLVGLGAALLARRQRPLKLTYNVCQLALEIALALVVFHAVVGSQDPTSSTGWAAAFAATLTVDTVSSLALFAAMSLSAGTADARRLPRVLASSTASALVNTTLALVTVLVARDSFWALWLVVVVVAALHAGARRYAVLAQRHTRLSSLYSLSEALGSTADGEGVTRAVLDQSRRLLRAERAELTLLGPRMRARRSAMDRDEELATASLALSDGSLEMRAVTGRAPVLAAAGTADQALGEALEKAGARDAMVVALHDADRAFGTLSVQNRLGDAASFTGEDLRLFETLAAHASVAVQKDRLLAQLRQEAAEREHRALHDPLTGLPNRALFTERVDQALREAGAGIAVLLIDLDRFKEVNDTLGHHSGDTLLVESALRLERALGRRGMIGRLAGDEFGVLLSQLGSPSSAIEVADDLKEALGRPLVLENLTIEVSASAGIALYPAHGSDATALLQRADVAKRAAKASPGDTEVYSPDHDRHTPRRLELVGELRRAIEDRELTVYYQPIVALRTGEAVGAEALLRWPHPRLGFLPPDEFVPVAERTGLIRPLTDLALESAVEQCARWARRGSPLTVAVNISARSLADQGLPERIRSLLDRAGIPPHRLTLELTESSIMADLENAIGSLSVLSAMGTVVSVDDFGTGYSSLSYLQRLPIDEVKIDKSFILHMSTDTNDAVIVRSTVGLARNLGMRVLAEGVEDSQTADRLRALGCDLAQGYLFSRPVPPRRFEEWLDGWRRGGVRSEPAYRGLRVIDNGADR